MGYPIDKDCFLVLKGSRIAPDMTSGLPQNYVEQRKTLLGSGIIQNNVFAEDNVFTSASAAASIILGRSSNGRREWAKLDGRSIPLTPAWIKIEAGELVESTPHTMEHYTIPTPELPPLSLLRRKV